MTKKEFLDEWKSKLKKAAQWNDEAAEINKLVIVLENYLYLENIKPLKDELHHKINFCNESLALLPIYRKWFREMSTLISSVRIAQNFKSKVFKEFVTRKLRNFDTVTFSIFPEKEILSSDSKDTH